MYRCSNCNSRKGQVELHHWFCFECGHKTAIAEDVVDVPAGARFDRVTTTEDLSVSGG